MKRLIIFFISALFLLSSFKPSFAIYDPTTVPNNKFGIHILFPDEVFQAKDLINSKNGDWGYVTIPIQVSDMNLNKWQTFMDDCRDLHLIPIIRLATNGDYFNTKVWEKPSLDSVLDFANFLNSLDWPTKNRYVVIFNEVNRADEWGGEVSPSQYAETLSFAVDTFKSKNPDFFVISAGLDNAAPNQMPNFMNEYDYIRGMENAVPGIFSKVDGVASHSYPNPGFSQPSYTNTAESIYSFKYEENLESYLAGKKLPVFITETGWSQNSLSQDQIAAYFQDAYQNVWDDDNVIAVTPFLLRADGNPFSQFSFISEGGAESAYYKEIQNMDKVAGKPQIAQIKKPRTIVQTLPVRSFLYTIEAQNDLLRAVRPTKLIFKWLLKV